MRRAPLGPDTLPRTPAGLIPTTPRKIATYPTPTPSSSCGSSRGSIGSSSGGSSGSRSRSLPSPSQLAAAAQTLHSPVRWQAKLNKELHRGLLRWVGNSGRRRARFEKALRPAFDFIKAHKREQRRSRLSERRVLVWRVAEGGHSLKRWHVSRAALVPQCARLSRALALWSLRADCTARRWCQLLLAQRKARRHALLRGVAGLRAAAGAARHREAAHRLSSMLAERPRAPERQASLRRRRPLHAWLKDAASRAEEATRKALIHGGLFFEWAVTCGNPRSAPTIALKAEASEDLSEEPRRGAVVTGGVRILPCPRKLGP